MAIAANRVKGVFAVHAKDEADAYFARRHEDSKVLVFGSGYSDGVMEVKLCLRKAKRIIENEYMTIGGIYDVSQKLGVSQSHLTRIFSNELKSSPIEYLTRVRLQEAVNLLNSSVESIESIALKCGFSCGNYSECELKSYVVKNAHKVIMLIDSSKFDKDLPYTFCKRRSSYADN